MLFYSSHRFISKAQTEGRVVCAAGLLWACRRELFKCRFAIVVEERGFSCKYVVVGTWFVDLYRTWEDCK